MNNSIIHLLIIVNYLSCYQLNLLREDKHKLENILETERKTQRQTVASLREEITNDRKILRQLQGMRIVYSHMVVARVTV